MPNDKKRQSASETMTKRWEKWREEKGRPKSQSYWKWRGERSYYEGTRPLGLRLLGNVCYVCGRNESRPTKTSKGIRLEFHHITYDYREKYPKSSHNSAVNLDEVIAHPENFLLLCHRDHALLTYLLGHPQILPKLLEAFEKSKKLLKENFPINEVVEDENNQINEWT